ncbi:ranBP2-type zinc finger protein At1g67325-like isoform X2 [Tasmannia lanceolata]|uniref:ranBP2-type zinc finger protein At1g67325-like isoform X2 n=1 Tax=Tasmannia lanceolata TaxID=3420 RepID=UPI00406418B1
MSQVDNRSSSAAKRARTDGSRREDDWTCPSCGNVNFSFRTTCNMRNCTQSRPADHNSSAGKTLQVPQSYSSAYLGYSAPSSMYLRAPPYSSSLFNGTSLPPPYDLPISGGTGYHYDFGSRLSLGSPYGPRYLSGPSPYPSGSMLGAGGIYGMSPLMDRYGLGLPMGHAAMGAQPGVFLAENPQKKATGRDSDWTCPKCGNVNFSFRTVCNMRNCSTPKPGTQGSKSENSKGSKQKMPEGSWKCEKCNNINYPFRDKCNRQNCSAEKPSESNKSPTLTSNEDDQ